MFSWWSKHGFPFPDWWSYIYIWSSIHWGGFHLLHHVLSMAPCVDDHGVNMCQPRSTDPVRRQWYRCWRTFNGHEGIVSSQTIRRYRFAAPYWHQQLLKIVQNRGLSRWVAECESRVDMFGLKYQLHEPLDFWPMGPMGPMMFDWEKQWQERFKWAESRNPEGKSRPWISWIDFAG